MTCASCFAVEKEKWWARPESNRHASRRRVLSTVCLPLPTTGPNDWRREGESNAQTREGGGFRDRWACQCPTSPHANAIAPKTRAGFLLSDGDVPDSTFGADQ